MTNNEFLEFLRTDPVFKTMDKQIVATLYESPFDSASIDEDTGTLTIVYKGETITFAADNEDFGAAVLENPALEALLLAKRIIVNLGFDSNKIVLRPVAGGDNYPIEDFVTIPFADESEGGDDENNGGIG